MELNRYLRPFVGVLFLNLLLVTSVPADRSYALAVPRIGVATPPPTVDGVCDSLEYQTSWRFTRILYRPRVNMPPATLYLNATEADLYICLQGMPFRLGTVEPFVTVAFDPDHDGGRFANSNDLRFTLTETGTTDASRGNGAGGFTTDPSITDWEAATGIFSEFYWTAEFRIPLSLIGGGEPLSVIGFHIRHNWLRQQPDDYTWPPTAGWNVPDTWGDLLWLGPRGGNIHVDRARITQGLEIDATAGRYYEMIAGKDTLVRAQLYRTGYFSSAYRAECHVQRIRPTRGSEQVIPISSLSAARIQPRPYGYFNGAQTFDFWIPGARVAQPGQYRFWLVVQQFSTSPQETLVLGTRTLHESNELDLILIPWDMRVVADDAREWDSILVAAVAPAMNEFQRLMPLRAGAAPFNLRRGESQADAGLRYLFWPFFTGCGSTDSFDDCDRRGRTYANDMFHFMNDVLNRIDPGGALDRLDRPVLLGGSVLSKGGQAQFGWDPCSSGAGFDPNPRGWSASVIIQEVAHCLGQVRRSSPNTNGGYHSANAIIPLLRGLPVVNMLDRTDVTRPASVLYPFVDRIPISFTEGYEWNDLRQSLLALPSRVESTRRAAEAAQTVFHVVAQINQQDQVSVDYAQRLEDSTRPLSPQDPNSPYALVLVGAGDADLGQLSFPVDFHSTDHPDTGMHEADQIGLVLTMPYADGSVRFEIRNGNIVLFSRTFSDQPPTISNVIASDKGQDGVDLQWSANDPDSPNLWFNIFFVDDDAAITVTLPVATGLTDPAFFFPTGLVPATPRGRLIVEAIDEGSHSARGLSNPFAIPDKPPVVGIARPAMTDVLVAGQPVVLRGYGFDFTYGALTGQALEWSSNKDGALGTGERRETVLTAGPHTLSLTGTAPSGLDDSATTDVVVLADTDGDGLPDDYELQYPCLSESEVDSHEDPDGDTLISLYEWRIGTDPCSPDTDLDGIGDGDEFRLAADPLEQKILPLPDLIFVPENDVTLVTTVVVTETLTLRTLSQDLNWSLAPGADWLIATGNGPGDGSIQVEADPEGLPDGEHMAQILVFADGSQPVLIDVTLLIPPEATTRPRWRLYR